MYRINMKRILYLTISALILVSCSSQIQLVILETSTPGVDKEKLIFKDSLVIITYNFYDKKGTMKFTIYNIHNKPIFIDWKQCSYISSVNKYESYWTDKSEINMTSNSSELNILPDLTVSSGDIKGIINKKERITFLPPNTVVEVTMFKVGKKNFYKPGNKQTAILEKCNWKDTEKTTKIIIYKYSEEETPLSFRNYLAISTTEDFSKPIYYDFSFWLSEIHEMDIKQLLGSYYNWGYIDSVQSKSYHP